MSVATVMLVRDEADIIEPVIRHLAYNDVDEIVVSDQGSVDGTREILHALQVEGLPLTIFHDPDVAYWQSRKTTALAYRAWESGHQWVIPCDADEVWYDPRGRSLRDCLDGVGRDVQIVKADLVNHLPTGRDPLSGDWISRIEWHQRTAAPLPKVCARCRPDLIIEPGNHSARTNGTALAVPGLVIRHFSWRTRDQYLRKIRNGEAAYKLTDIPETIGQHWRMWAEHEDDTVREHFDRWFYAPEPNADDSLIRDPAPIWRERKEAAA